MRRSRIFFLPGGWEWSEEYLGLLGEGEGIRMYYDFFKGPYIPPPLPYRSANCLSERDRDRDRDECLNTCEVQCISSDITSTGYQSFHAYF